MVKQQFAIRRANSCHAETQRFAEGLGLKYYSEMLTENQVQINRITKEIIDAAITVHRELGPGLMESVYETAMLYELHTRGFDVKRQHPIPVIYRDMKLDDGFRCDLIVNGLVIIELKSVDLLAPVFFKKLLTYIRLADKRVGLLINFNEAQVKDGIHRIVNRF